MSKFSPVSGENGVYNMPLDDPAPERFVSELKAIRDQIEHDPGCWIQESYRNHRSDGQGGMGYCLAGHLMNHDIWCADVFSVFAKEDVLRDVFGPNHQIYRNRVTLTEDELQNGINTIPV